MSDPNLSPESGEALRQLLSDPENHSTASTPSVEPAQLEAVRDGINRSFRSVNSRARQALSPYKHRTKRLLRRVNPRYALAQIWRRDGVIESHFADVQILRSELLSMGLRLDAFQAAQLDQQISQLATNLELIKAELRGVSERIEELGFAIAPGAGLVGASPRMAELRERLNAIDRRVRQLADSTSPAAFDNGDIPASPPATGLGDAAVTPGGSGFDYVGFEQRFRGDAATITAIIRERYLELLRPHAPVLDVGCGRGELLEMLRSEGIAAVGVDLDAGMAAEAKSKGLDAHHGDAIAYLREQPEASLGAIISIHVVEHLELNDLVEFLELSATRLRPGGLFIAETPNPATLLVLGNSYVMDPTHVWPLHPSLFTFMCERAGFRSVDLLYGSPATDYQMALVPDSGLTAEVAKVLNPSIERLNNVLFGPQEYAVMARTPV